MTTDHMVAQPSTVWQVPETLSRSLAVGRSRDVTTTADDYRADPE